MPKAVQIQTIQFSISTQFSSIWPIGRILSGATISDQSGFGSHHDKGALCIPQTSSITNTSLSDCFVSYLRHYSGKSYPTAETQSVYSTVQADWTTRSGSFTPLPRNSRCILQPLQTFCGSLTPLERSSWYNLLPLPTGPLVGEVIAIFCSASWLGNSTLRFKLITESRLEDQT